MLRKLLRRAALAAVLFGAVAVLAGAMLDRLFPPDLTRYRDRSTLVLDADGQPLRVFTSRDGMWRVQASPDDVDPLYLKYLVAYEDKRFWHHWGVDPVSTARAAGQFVLHGHIVSGASTLTMQTARLLEPHSRDLWGKLIEMARAVQLELHYSKREILTIYLTLAPYGGNIEGVRAASLAYFGKEPSHLDPAEAALLVALPQSPERRRPDLRMDSAAKARQAVIARLLKSGAMTARQAAAAQARAIPDRRIAMPFYAPHLAQSIDAALPQGGVVRTTLKLDLQRALENLLASDAKHNADGADMALVAIDNRSHKVLAYVGSVDFFGKAGQNDLARARRSPGSTLKPFAYGLAFDDGFIHPETLIDDEPMRFGDYAPRNFDHDYQGTVSIRQALQMSLNLPAVAIVQRLGAERFSASLQNAGITLAFPRDSQGGSLSVILGGVGISLYDLTSLYSGLANGGEMALPVYLANRKPQSTGRLMNDSSAWYVTDILRGSAPPPGFPTQGVLQGSRKIAFKTGTSYGFRDAWSVGYSPSYTIGVWVGHADGTPRPGQLARIAALPTLLKAFDLMPPEDVPDRRMPANVVLALNNGQLPARLQSFTLTPVETAVAGYGPRAVNRPRILYPPDGAMIDLRGRPEKARDLVLKAEGGTLPLRWVVNDKPMPALAPMKRNMFWTPDGDGFVRIAVIDADGRSASVQVRLQSN